MTGKTRKAIRSRKTLLKIYLIFSLFLVLSFLLNMALYAMQLMRQQVQFRQEADYAVAQRVEGLYSELRAAVDTAAFSFEVDSLDAVPNVIAASEDGLRALMLRESELTVDARGSTVPFVRDSDPYRVYSRMRGMVQSISCLDEIALYLPGSGFVLGVESHRMTSYAHRLGDAGTDSVYQLAGLEPGQGLPAPLAVVTPDSCREEVAGSLHLLQPLDNGAVMVLTLCNGYLQDNAFHSGYGVTTRAQYSALAPTSAQGRVFAVQDGAGALAAPDAVPLDPDAHAGGAALATDAGRFLLLQREVGDLDLVFSAAFPDRLLAELGSYLLRAAALYGVIWLVLGGMGGALLAWTVYRPVSNLVEQLPDALREAPLADDYTRLAHALRHYTHQTQRYEDRLSAQGSRLTDSLLLQLLTGVAKPSSLRPEDVAHLNGDGLLDAYHVVAVRLRGDETITREMAAHLEELLRRRLQVHPLLAYRNTLLTVVRGCMEREALCRELAGCGQEFFNHTETEVLLYCSEAAAGPEGAAEACSRALTLPPCAAADGGEVQAAGPGGGRMDSRRMLKLEIKLSEEVAEKRYDRASHTFRELLEFLHQAPYSPLLRESWVSGLVGRLCCILIESNPKAVEQLNRIPLLQHAAGSSREQLCALWTELCDALTPEEPGEHSAQFAAIRKFVRSNYRDPSLSLARIAEAFSVSMPYVSKEFQKNLGIGFLDYLHRLRVEAAKEEMRSTDKPVKDIAAQVGYSNPLTMTRAFKKYEGVTPGAFRAEMES